MRPNRATVYPGTDSEQHENPRIHEPRTTRRYELHEIVMFSWERADGGVSQVTGITRDLSRGGVSLIVPVEIEVGTRIKLDFHLRSVTQQREIELHAEGIVLRVEPLGAFGSCIAAEVVFQEEPDGMLLSSSAIQ